MPPNNDTSHKHNPLPGFKEITRKNTSVEWGKNLLKTFVFHFRPRTVPEASIRFTHTFGLGGIALVLVALLFSTGLLLKMVYKPFPGMAYDSILMILHDVPFGLWVRNIHHWSANLLVIVLFLHMQRVFFTGGHYRPRQFNWVVGLILFLLVLASNFTGYLLPWDQLAFWAITICTGMLDYVPIAGSWLQRVIRGGSEIGPSSLLIFFTFHSAILPASIFLVMLFHFWRIRKAGGLVTPVQKKGKKTGQRIAVVPDLMLRELVVALAAVAFVLIFSILFDAPLDMKANPGLSPNPAKAPWFFIGLQEMLLHIHPALSVMVVPVILLGMLALVPYVEYESQTGGIWFFSERGRRMGIAAAMAALVLSVTGIIADEYVLNFMTALPAVSPVISSGIIPVGIFAGVTALVVVFLQRRFSAVNNEVVQSLYIFLMVVYIVLTVTCLWFRGREMALTWPLS